MKKTITLISATVLSAACFGQAITLNSTDVPVPTAPFNINIITGSSPASPSLGDNQAWDYSANGPNNQAVNDYPLETDTFFTNAGIDIKFDGSKALNQSLGYYVTNEYDFNTNGIYESGMNIIRQGYGLSGITGVATDSMVFPAQQYLFSNPKTIMSFPCTANSSWQSVSHRVTDFNLTVAAYFLNNTPGQHVYDYVRKDSIVGWGKMIVYTTSGPSIQYDVLMERVEQYAVDSFYLNGSPAPPTLLTAFQVAQGQRTNVQYSYNFYRAGSFNYLMRFYYDTDSTFTTLADAYQNTDNITYTNEISGIRYSALIFPNPSAGSEINIRILGAELSMKNYEVYDQSGMKVQSGVIETGNGESAKLKLNDELANGFYSILVKDKEGRDVVKEKITLQR